MKKELNTYIATYVINGESKTFEVLGANPQHAFLQAIVMCPEKGGVVVSVSETRNA